MENHFDLTIYYDGRNMEVHVQCLSSELPKITYFVSPKDEELKKSFENFNLFFIEESVTGDSDNPSIKYTVFYDYKSKDIEKYRNIKFEIAIWEKLTFREIL